MVIRRKFIVAWLVTLVTGAALLLASASSTYSEVDPKTQFLATIQAVLEAARERQLSQTTSQSEQQKLDDIASGGVPALPDEPWDVGIFTDADAPFPAEEYTFKNMYQGVYDAQNYVQVYAGALSSNDQQGVAIVLISRRDGADAAGQPFLPTSLTGALTVMAVAIDEVVLKSASGSYYTLDIREKVLTPGKPVWYTGA